MNFDPSAELGLDVTTETLFKSALLRCYEFT